MLKKVKWKAVAAVVAVVAAGVVYSVFFAEEKEDTVIYRIGEGVYEDGTDATLDRQEPDGINIGYDAAQDSAQNVADDVKDASDAGKSEKLIYVHVCGAVRNPGVYALAGNSRVCDVIAMAGGFMETAADDYVNQARFLTDGERVYIPQKDELSDLDVSQYAAGQQSSGAAGNGSQGSTQQQAPVNINTAGISELTTLPGIGESRAESIIAYRERYGAFSKAEDIMKISGIKAAAYDKIKDRICTGNE